VERGWASRDVPDADTTQVVLIVKSVPDDQSSAADAVREKMYTTVFIDPGPERVQETRVTALPKTGAGVKIEPSLNPVGKMIGASVLLGSGAGLRRRIQ
jgi:hypothetical protein